MEQPQAYLGGRFIPASDAALSPTDAGFVLGAAVAEQVRTFRGQLFRLEDHLERLWRSLATVGIDPGMGRADMAQVARELALRNHRLLDPDDDLGLSIFVTPGPYPAYAERGAPPGPTVCLHTYRLPFHRWADKYRTGQALRVTEVRQVGPECWPPELKCRSRMHYYLADRLAAEAEPGARALVLDREGFVTEASTANLLIWRREEGLVSPPYERILRGISMDVALELGRGLGIPASHRDLREEDVAAAGEALLTSTPLCLVPVTRFNGRPVGAGRPGEVFERLLAAWSAQVGVDIAAQAERFAGRR